MKKIVFISLVSACVLLCGGGLNAATVTSVADGNWSSTSTWDCACVPATSDDVIVGHNVTLVASVAVTGGSITVNTGATLSGAFSITGSGSYSGSPFVFTNRGTVSIEAFQISNGGGANADFTFENYGTFTVNQTGGSSGTSPFAFRNGNFYVRAGGVLNVPNGPLYIGGSTNTGYLEIAGTVNANEWLTHSTSSWRLRPSGLVNVTGLMRSGSLSADVEGCVNALGGFQVFEKTSNGGNGRVTVRDGGKIMVTGALNVNSNTTLDGVDDDGNDANNGCISVTGSVSNSGTISGEFYLNDADGAVPGTVGPNVTLGTGDCGGGCVAAAPCTVSINSATPSVCDPATSTYSLAVNVSWTMASGTTLTVSVPGGMATLAVAAGSDGTNQIVTITGLTADGTQDIDVTAQFDATCTTTATDAYDAPANCCPAPQTFCPALGESYDLTAQAGLTGYQWYLGGVAIPGPAGTMQVYNATVGGVYTWTALDAGNCPIEGCCPLTLVESCTTCTVTINSSTPSACVPATNTYSLTVNVSWANASGTTLTVTTTAPGATPQTITTTAGSSGTQSVTFTGLTPGVAMYNVTAQFGAGCTATTTNAFTAPPACTGCPTGDCRSTTVLKKT